MAVRPELMTADDLFRMADDSMRHELVRGELRTMPPGGFEHGEFTSKFDISLGNHVLTRRLGRVVTGDTGFKLSEDPDTVRAPDVAFVSNDRFAGLENVRGYFPGAPDLAVEVISPNDLYTEVEEKVAEWLENGVRLVFVVNPRRRTVAVHRPGQPVRILGLGEVLDGEDVVPGWSLSVRDLFASVQDG